jgi:hypothetical protein
MNWSGGCLWVCVAVVLLVVEPAVAASSAVPGTYVERLYRYRDAQGRVVIDDAVPPEFAHNGYEILNKVGQVLEVVPRQLTASELANLTDEEKAKRNAKALAEKQQIYDESLLLRYSDVADIEAARERGFRELQIRLSIVRGNMMQIKANLEREQQKAADIERGGRKVPDAMRQNIHDLRQQIDLNEGDIELRKKEVEELKAQYQQEIDRFRYLTEVKGYRR